MTRATRILPLVCLLQLVLLPGVRGRLISDVTYRFTTCNTQGREGPGFLICGMFYSGIESPIDRDEVLFPFRDTFRGGQGFRVPRAGLYNITLAGASGGRGLCNLERGRGEVRRIQAYLSPEVELLVMVGQKGLGPCDSVEDHELCQNPPKTVNESQNCNQTWFEYLQRDYNGNGEFDYIYDTNGGGGGGGASMIRARNVSSGEFYEFPIAVAGGGGGSPAVMDYEVIEPFRQVFERPNSSLSSEDFYREFLDAKSFRSPNISIEGTFVEGFGGYFGYGDGAGWKKFPDFFAVDFDGRPLSRSDNFAEGGLSCESQDTSIEVPFTRLYGGFGGGGGGCGRGGGGAGYTGGAVPTIDNDNTIPGGGGYSATFFLYPNLNISDLDVYLSEAGSDGYVEIIPGDYGCAEEYMVYNDAEFECLCGGDSLLAPDESDCYRERDVTVEKSGLVSVQSEEQSFSFAFYRLQDATLIYSIEAVLSVDSQKRQVNEEEAVCALIFIAQEESGDNEISLVSTHVSPALSEVANRLAVVTSSGNASFEISEFEGFLDFPHLVTGVIIAGNTVCSLEGMRFRVNASTQDVDADPVNFEVFSDFATDPKYHEDIAEFTEAILGITEPAPPPSTPSPNSIIIALVVVVTVLAILVLAIIFILIAYRIYQRRRTKKVIISTLEVPILNSPGISSNGSSLASPTSPPYPTAFEDSVVQFVAVNENAEHGYEMLEYEKENDTSTLPPSVRDSHLVSKYGISAPAHDFFNFNRKRSNSSIRDHDWQYPRDRLTYMREIGEGQFGKVLLMKAKSIAGYVGNIPVAVKTLTSKDPAVVQKFKEEAELMKKFAHPNIVSLLGFNEGDDDEAAPLIILEYMPFGDLQSFLVSQRPTEGKSHITEKHFYIFARDIACALQFLSESKYVHRDVAARNCLVGAKLSIKIADFGLTRGVYNKDYYRVAGRAVLPVRWMSPEALLYGVFTTASDVWAYGVVLWEIMTYGEFPLDILEPQDIVDAAQEKILQHPRPGRCPNDLYEIMASCHNHEQDQRPTFEEIFTKLDAVVASMEDKSMSETGTVEGEKQNEASSPTEDSEAKETSTSLDKNKPLYQNVGIDDRSLSMTV